MYNVSRKEEIAIHVCVHYMYICEGDETVAVEERLLAVTDTNETTGEALSKHLLDCLAKHGLGVQDIVGQGYDGGSNMRGASKGVQARIKQLNAMALFTHCFAHNLNRALVNAACDSSTADARNFFGIIELVQTFVQGSASRHGYFIEQQKKLNEQEVPLHLVGLSDTRWNCRASSLRRLCNEKVFRAVIATVEHVSLTTTDGSVRGTAAGTITSITTFKFLLSLHALTPVLEAINNVSEFLQSPNIDILLAQQQIQALCSELRRMRSNDTWESAVLRAQSMAQRLNLDSEMPPERERKVSRRLDANIANAAVMSPLERMKVNFYFPVMDKLVIELEECFPAELQDFAFLDPKHFGAMDAELRVRRLASRYKMLDGKTGSYTDLDVDKAVSQWRLAHSFIQKGSSLADIYSALPKSYTELLFLYKVLITLPVTTASVERSFSKLALVKSKLRSTMGQARLEALMLSSVEPDLLLNLNDSTLVDSFAAKADRKMLLA